MWHLPKGSTDIGSEYKKEAAVLNRRLKKIDWFKKAGIKKATAAQERWCYDCMKFIYWLMIDEYGADQDCSKNDTSTISESCYVYAEDAEADGLCFKVRISCHGNVSKNRPTKGNDIEIRPALLTDFDEVLEEIWNLCLEQNDELAE